MKRAIILLLIPAFVLYGVCPVVGDNAELRLKIEKAKQDGKVLRIRTSLEDEVIGSVVSIQEEHFSLLNPLTRDTYGVRWDRVQQVREAHRYGEESQGWLESLEKRRQVIRVQLLDGVVHKGHITRVNSSGFTLQSKKDGEESRILYEDILMIDQEPTGQKVVRKVMIGVAVGLAATLTTLAWLLRGD